MEKKLMYSNTKGNKTPQHLWHRLLLVLITMLTGITGAWAQASISGETGGSLVVITTNDDSNLSALNGSTALSGNWGSNTSADNGVKVSGTITQAGLDVINNMMAQNSQMHYPVNKYLYLNEATLSGTINSLPAGTSTSQYPTDTKFAYCILPADTEMPATIPTTYEYVYSGCSNGGTIRIHVNQENASISQFTSEQISAASTIIVTGSAKDSFISGMSAAAKEKLPFDGGCTITTTASNNVQSQLEAYLISKGVLVDNATEEQKATALAQVTSLTISGPLTSADVTYLSSLTNLATLNLTGVTSFGSGVSKSTIEAALPNGVTVNWPTLFYSTANGVTTITVLTPGGATSEALTSAAGVPGSIDDGTIKIVGEVTAADITNIDAHANNGWNTRRIDLSEATLSSGETMPRLSGNPQYLDPYYLILPVGSSDPTDVQIAYTNDNAYNSTNGIYNGYDDLKYIIIPAETEGGHAKIFVNKPKNNMASAIDSYDIAVINANNPSVIDVYNMDGAFEDGSFTTLETAINNQWSSTKTVVFHRSVTSFIVDECNITIDMDNANGKTFSELLAEAKAAMTADPTQTQICTLTVSGAMSAEDVTALNTAMGANDGDLADITRLNLGEATGVTQTQVDNLQLPSSLTSLVLPKDKTVSTALSARMTAITGLMYAYSPSSDAQRLEASSTGSYNEAKNKIADYVWVNKAGGLAQAFTNEEWLRNSFYIKVASSVALNNADVNFDALDTKKPTNYLFLDFSGANLTPAVAAGYVVTDDLPYRIILPDDWTGDQMAVFSANPNKGSLAAVYSYHGTRLDILEISDASYSTTALANPRIVRTGTTMINVVSGTYNGNVYSACGPNLIAAINGAQSSITSVKIATGNNILNAQTYTATFANPNLTSLDLSGEDFSNGKSLNVDGCSSLQTLNLSYTVMHNLDASVSTLASVDLTGAEVYGYADFSTSSLATAFTTTEETTLYGNLDLHGTNITSFVYPGNVGGDINLSDCDNLTSINLLQTQFNTQWGSNTTSKIHIHKTNDENETDIIDALKVSGSIQVPTGFDKENRIHPYAAASTYIKEAEYVAPAVVFTATDMTLHEPEAAADGDKLVYWYAGDTQNEGIATVTMGESRVLSDLITNNSLGTNRVKVKIVGPLTAADVTALKNINATVLDLSEATCEVPGTTIGELLKAEFSTNSLHANTKFLILPDTCSREHIVNATALAGLTNIWSVVATKPNNSATNVDGASLGNGYDFTSYTKVPGTLQAATVQALSSATGDYSRTPNINGTATSKRVYLSNISNFRDLKISGVVTAYDLCRTTTVDKYGHLEWNQAYTEAATESNNRALVGQNVYGPFSSSFNVTSIDLEKATFVQTNPATNAAHDYVTDMTLPALQILSSKATNKVVIPTDPSVKELPADFLNASVEIDAICIPYNIEHIRSRAFYTIDYVWTTSGSTDPEGANTILDNGAEYTTGTGEGATTTLQYATNWDGDKKVKDNFDYTVEPTGGSYTFSSNLKVIESGAFSNTRPHVKDVYVLNPVAPECHVDAFNTAMYFGNSGYAPVIQDGIITRDSYQNGGEWITMLHYPRQTVTPNVQRYTDPTRNYSIATGERDGKGATLYFPNQSEFIRAYTQGTYGYTWNAWDPTRQYGSVNNGTFANVSLSAYNSGDQANANTNYTNYTGGGANHQWCTFYDVTAGGSKPSDLQDYYNIYWNESSYSNSGSEAQHLYPRSEIEQSSDVDNSGEITSKDYRGWHQFVLNAFAANTTVDHETFRSYITDNEWWTYCPTFDITREQAILLFGTPSTGGNIERIPYISKLLYVRRDYDNNQIALCFSKNLMLNKESRATSTIGLTKDESGNITAVTNASQHGVTDDNGVLRIFEGTVPEAGDVVMSAGVPYMIKPYMPSGNVRMFQVYPNQQEAQKVIDQYAALHTDMNTLPFKQIVNETLYGMLKYNEGVSGTDQMAFVQSGLYSVPVFVKGTTSETTDGNSYTIANDTYSKSTKWKYTFVGSFYKSFLPGNSYFLGWDSSNNRAKFFYNDKPDANVMRWANETGIICPTAPNYTFEVTHASGNDPAQWKIPTTKTTVNSIEAYWLSDDSLISAGGGSAKSFDQFFDSPDVISSGGTIDTNIDELRFVDTTEVKVYNINGQYIGNDLHGLSKGVYIVNGKKFIVR